MDQTIKDGSLWNQASEWSILTDNSNNQIITIQNLHVHNWNAQIALSDPNTQLSFFWLITENFKCNFKKLISGFLNITDPVPIKPDIVIPIMQHFQYTSNESIVDLYIELLSKAWSQSTQDEIHVWYIDIIKNLDTIDVLILEKLIKPNQLLPIWVQKLHPRNSIQWMEFSFKLIDLKDLKLINQADPSIIRKHFDNLERLNLIKYDNEKFVWDRYRVKWSGQKEIIDLYDDMFKQADVFMKWKEDNRAKITYHRSLYGITDLWKDFLRICSK